ncbi:MAG: hypothetical protein M1836_003012 [Candelina mexicana]|nr:MAG: hypothetical protein M1836_003012 [Candelina mexicana]
MPPARRARQTFTIPMRRRRSTRTRISYKEPDSEESSSEDRASYGSEESFVEDVEPSVQTSRKRKRVSSSGADKTPSSKATPSHGSSKLAANTSSKAIKKVSNRAAGCQGTGRIPKWHTLPYHILLQVFSYAIYPLCDTDFRSLPSLPWVVNASLVCKAFTEPALTALYRCPPLLPSDRPHALLKLLNTSSGQLSLDYTRKIKSLKIEVSQTLAYSSPGLGHLDLGQLIRRTPQLQQLELFHLADQPPYRNTNKVTERWKYQDSIFAALVETDIRLRSWRWNTRMNRPKDNPGSMQQLHKSIQFQSIQRLALVNYHARKRRAVLPEEATEEEKVALALSVLPNLRSLICESSTVVNNIFLRALPRQLVYLSFINCSSLSSETFRSFLATHGASIKKLTLNHNQSLSLSFLPELNLFCPNLEVLTMDLTCFKSLNGTNPGNEIPLLPGEVPAWPPTIQKIELIQFRIPSAETAEMFFNSLIDAASCLIQLRTLILKVILKLGWRDRASFRKKWIGKLREVFLRDRNSDDTQSHGNPKGLCQESCHEQMNTNSEDSDSDAPILPKRRSTRLANSEHDIFSLPTVEGSTARQAQLIRRARQENVGIHSTINERESSIESEIDGSARRNCFPDVENGRQGMCEVVDIRIDNLRPAEEQFNENDFLDSEVSGDEDWDGDDVLPGEERYAW